MSISQPNPRVKLISFGAGIPNIDKALARLKKQALKLGYIDDIETYSAQDLDEEYHRKFKESVRLNPKGFGLWSWKPFLIQKASASLREGDVLIYLDAGVEINIRGKNRFLYYLDHVARHDILLFSLGTQHREWTKQDPILLGDDKYYFRNQVVAGVLIFRISDRSKAVIEHWAALCELEGGRLLEENLDHHTQSDVSTQKHHRHDQSVLSRVAFEHEVFTIPDETYFQPWRRGRNFPFLALRNKASSTSWIWPATNLPKPIFELLRFVFRMANKRRSVHEGR